jgi:hypothetical protein
MYLSNQAMTILVCNFIIFILLLANIFIPRNDSSQKRMSKTGSFVVLFLLVLPFMILSVYSVNCMIVGQCTTWSWILSGLVIIAAILYIIGFIQMIIIKKKERV